MASSYMEFEDTSQHGSSIRGLSRLFSNQSGLEGASKEAIANFVATKLRVQARKLEKVHNLEMKNMKKVMLQVTVDWMKDKCKAIENMFTKNHKEIVQQFQDYKERTKV